MANKQPEDAYLKAIFNDENGAKHELLVELASKVINGEEIEPDFQKVVNAIVTQSLFCGSLPPRKKGRPKNHSGDGIAATRMYFDLRDGGMGYADAAAKVSDAFNKEERQIMRLVKQHQKFVGKTKEERNDFRKFEQFLVKSHLPEIEEGRKSIINDFSSFYQESLRKAQERDFLGELEALIKATLAQRFSTDIK